MNSLTPNLMVKNVRETVAFYQENFDLQVVASVPEDAPTLNWAMVTNGPVTLMFQSVESLQDDIAIFKNMPLGASLNFYVKVEDVPAYLAKLKDKVTIVDDLRKTFYGALEFTFQDLNGYFVTLAQDVVE